MDKDLHEDLHEDTQAAVQQAARRLHEARYAVAFTGAGISVESGVPPFRGSSGLWAKYDPEVLSIDYFWQYPEQSWEVIRELYWSFFSGVEPNDAHRVLAEWEQAGVIQEVITQNIDGLHQQAGSKAVWEYHGNARRLTCQSCGTVYDADPRLFESVPARCECGGLLKPEFVFFGESIPLEAAEHAAEAARQCDLMLVIGTTGEVFPASIVPWEAAESDATIVEVNPEKSNYTGDITDVFVQLPASRGMRLIAQELKSWTS
jgi:NAD-dependent deacetylase